MRLDLGTQGTVRLAFHSPTNHSVALKVVRKTGDQRGALTARDFRREVTVRQNLCCGLQLGSLSLFADSIQILRALRHRQVCQLFDAFETESNFYLVMEFCSGGSLFDRIGRLGPVDEVTAARYVASITNAGK